MTDTPNLALPYILAAQAQKHVTHNEAIRALDCLVQLSVESRTLTAPPSTPADGNRFVIAASPTGAWSGHANEIAAFQDGAWAFYEPKEGWIAWVADESVLVIYAAEAWSPFAGSGGDGGGTGLAGPVANSELANMSSSTIKGRASAGSGSPEDLNAAQATALLDVFTGSGASHKKGLVPDPGATPGTAKYLREDGTWQDLSTVPLVGVNATADATNKFAMKGGASLFDNDGNGHQQKINKAAATDTASQLYQTNYSGRAEIGLTGNDDFHFKVSADGSSWREAIVIDRATGRADFPNTGFAANRNRIINPCLQYAQAALGLVADGAYTGIDQWLALTQSNAVTSSQLTDVANGVPFMGRLTQANATAQRMGWLQPLESAFVRDLRGKTVALQFQAQMSAATTLRYALVEWTGTADSITKDVVNSWTSGTFTPGNFFNASNLTIAAIGSVALMADTLTKIELSGAISSSMNNLMVFMWTDTAQAQNVTLDIGNVYLGAGAAAPAAFISPDPQTDFLTCLRYFWVWDGSAEISRPVTLCYSASATSCRGLAVFPAPMRAAPTMTVSSAAHFQGSFASGFNFTALSASPVTRFAAFLVGAASGMTTSQAGVIRNTSTDARINFDARL